MKKSNIIAIITLFMLAVIPAVAAWSQLPTKSNFVFAAEKPATVIQVADLVITPADSIDEVTVTARVPTKSSYHNIAPHKVSMPAQCRMQELEQQGAPTARYVRVCG
jgi:hypothetical protein